jgi:hypothetical protein
MDLSLARNESVGPLRGVMSYPNSPGLSTPHKERQPPVCALNLQSWGTIFQKNATPALHKIVQPQMIEIATFSLTITQKATFRTRKGPTFLQL